MLGLCALPSALSKPVQRRKILFSTEAIPDFNALPLQARLGLFFSFLPALCPFCLNFHQREARCFSVGKNGYFVFEGFSRQLPLATAAHNWLSRLQRGGLPVLLISFPYLGSKIAHGRSQSRVWIHRLFLECFGSGRVANSRSNL